MGYLKNLTSNIRHIWNVNKAVAPIGNTEVGLAQLNYNGAEDPSNREAIYPNWFFSAHLGQPHGKDIRKLRRLADSVWTQMVLNSFKKQITTINWKIVNEDEEDETDRSKDIKLVNEYLMNINDNDQTVNDMNSELITDIGVLDAGVANYVFSSDSYTIGEIPVYNAWGRVQSIEQGLVLKPLGQRKLIRMKTADGATILKQVDIHKNLLNYWQYSFKHPRQNPTRFEKEELSYLMMNPRPHDIYGFSPVESIQQVLELLIQGTRYNKDMYTNNAIPDILVSLPKLPKTELKKLKREWNNSYKGKPHQVGFINWLIDKVQVLQRSNRDLEWLDGQRWYFKIPFGAFGVSPTEAGFFENSNKSNDDGQERTTIRNALKPYMHLLEQLHTKKTITEILQKEDHGLKFKFFPKDHTAEKIEFEQDVKELELGVMTINEYRKKKGKDPVEWGNEPLRRPFNPETSFVNFTENSKDSRNPATSGSNDQSDSSPDSNPKSDVADKSSWSAHLWKKKDGNITTDFIEEAENYVDFLNKTFDRFEKNVLKAIDKIDESVIDKMFIEKTFGDFLRDLFNKVNTVVFANQVKVYLKQDLVKGMLEAEKETNIDIGFTRAYEDHLNKLQAQQVDGYTINGKRWPGIKGVTKEIQAKVIKTVQQALSENKSPEEIKKLVREDFKNFSDWRSNMIARTETNRIINEGKIIGYRETKLPGKMVWKSTRDGRTSEICQRLDGQKKDINELFIDDMSMKSFRSPPAHPNCRSTITFVPD